MNDPKLLTENEHEAVELSAQLYNLIKKIIGDGSDSKDDIQEMELYIHLIQNMILSQAAARAYPKMYRLLGRSMTSDKPE